MRIVLVAVVIAGLSGLFWWQKNSSHQTATQSVSAPPAQQTPAPSAGYGATPSREPSEHNWMKRSLDRARDVTQQSRARTRDSQDP